jgi:hypothetical protein
MKRLLVAAAMLMAAVVTAPIAAAQSWERSAGPGAAFSFEMPGKPQYTTSQGQAGGQSYTVHQYMVEIDPRAYVVQTAIYPANVNVSEPKRNLQSGLDNAAKNNEGGKWTSVKWTKFKGLEAVEAAGTRDGNAVRNFSLLKGSQIISMTYAGPRGSAPSPEADRFLRSLKIP